MINTKEIPSTPDYRVASPYSKTLRYPGALFRRGVKGKQTPRGGKAEKGALFENPRGIEEEEKKAAEARSSL